MKVNACRLRKSILVAICFSGRANNNGVQLRLHFNSINSIEHFIYV